MAISSPINKASFTNPSILKELKAINVVTMQLNNEKKKRFNLQKKFDGLIDRYGERTSYDERESAQEKKDTPVGKSFKKFVKNQFMGLGSFLFDLMKVFIGYKILEWAANPENLQKVIGIVKGLSGIFKFINWFATGSIDNALSGLHSLLFGGSILERIFGFFKAVIGFFGIRYLLNPLKIIKDLNTIIKNGDKIGEVFSAFRKSGIVSGVEKLLQSLPKTASVFKHGLSRGLTRGLLKVFGKGGFQFLSKIAAKSAPTVTKFLVEPIKAFSKKTVAGIPIVGPLLSLGINLALGDPIDKAIIKTVGSTLGMGLGGLIGSAIPGPGTIVGGVLGGLLGDWAASTLYDWVKGMFSKQKTPELAAGGIVTRPTKAIVGEAGPEAVVPLSQLYSGDVFSEPLAVMGSGLIGAIDAFVSSLGTTGVMIRPFSNQLLAPYSREFGSKSFVFNSDIGKNSKVVLPTGKKENNSKDKDINKILGNKEPKLLTTKDTNPRARYNSGNSVFALLGDIYNSLVNLDFDNKNINVNRGGNGGSGGAGGGGMLPGDAPPEVKAMLDAIAGGEGSWNSVNPSLNVPGLSDMTIAQARLKALEVSRGKGSGAMGKWQQMPQFILERARDAGLDPNKDKFNQENQTKIARMLMASVYPGGESQLVKDAQRDPLAASAKLRGTWPSLPGGSQENAHSRGFLARYNTNVERYQKMQTGGAVFDPRKYQEGMKSSRYITVGTNENAKSYSIGYVREGSSGTYTIKSISKKVSGNLFGGDNLTSVKISSDEGKRVLNSANVKDYFRTVPNGGLSRNLKLELKPDAQSDIFWAYNQSYQTTKNEWLKKGVSLEQAEQYAASAAKEFVLTRRGASWKPGSSNGLDGKLGDTSVSGPSETSSQKEDDVNWTKMAQSLVNLYQGFNKTDGNSLSKNSMDMVWSMKQQPFISDTYIITPGTTTISNVNLINPLPAVDYTPLSYSQLDSHLLPKRNL